MKPGDRLVSVDLQDTYMHIPIHRKFPKIQNRKTNIPIQGAKFWLSVSTMSIHKINGIDTGSSQRRRNICISLSRRLDPKIPTKNNITKKLTRLLEIWDWCGLIRNTPKSLTDFHGEDTSRHRKI